MLAVKRSISGARHTLFGRRLRDSIEATVRAQVTGSAGQGQSRAFQALQALVHFYDTLGLDAALTVAGASDHASARAREVSQ